MLRRFVTLAGSLTALVLGISSPARAQCSITCPANVFVSTPPSSCESSVNVMLPTTSPSGCATSMTFTYLDKSVVVESPLPAMWQGSGFPVGVTTVTATVPSGASCSFDVTVSDIVPPIAVCPADMVVEHHWQTDGACPVVNYDVTGTDNCGFGSNFGLTQLSGLPSGSRYPNGTTQNCFTVTDAAGNQSQPCCFKVVYSSDFPPDMAEPCDGKDNNCDGRTDEPKITCPEDMAVFFRYETDATCPVAPPYGIIAQDSCAPGDPEIRQFGGWPSGERVPAGESFYNCFEVGDPDWESPRRDTCCFYLEVASDWPVGMPEPCDGKDNDCDFRTDEDEPLANQWCDTGALGLCQGGRTSCEPDGDLYCKTIRTPRPFPDACDQPDFDCDGKVRRTPPECKVPGGKVIWGMMELADGSLKGFRCVVPSTGGTPTCDAQDGVLTAYPPMCQ